MKKTISLTLAVVFLLGCLLPMASALPECGQISLRLHSDIAGCTEKDVDQIMEILSPQVIGYVNKSGNGPIDIANYAGGPEYAHMEAGRSYTITYMLTAAEGYELPEELADGDVVFDCGKGVDVVYCKVASMHVSNPDPHVDERIRVLRIMANVVVDGNPLQRVIGWFRDIILKIRSWQLY